MGTPTELLLDGFNSPRLRIVKKFFCLLLLVFGTVLFGQEGTFQPNPSAGPGRILVHSKLGGQIFGF